MIPCKPTACDDTSRLCNPIESSEAQTRRSSAWPQRPGAAAALGYADILS